MKETMGGTPFETERFKSVLLSIRDELRETRLIQNRNLHRLERDLDNHETVEMMMRDIADSGVIAAGVSVLREMYKPENGEARRYHRLDEPLRLEDEDRFYIGDVEISGNVVNGGVLTVTGDLTIHGNYLEAADFCRLAVGGNLRVGNIISEHDIVALGELNATGVIYGRGSTTCLSAEGPLRARILVEDDHPTAYELIEVERHFATGIEDEAEGLLSDESLGPNGKVDFSLLRKLALNGAELIQESRPSQRHSLTPRMTQLVQTIRDATSYEFVEVAGKPAIRIVLEDGSRQISFVTEEERAIIGAVLVL